MPAAVHGTCSLNLNCLLAYLVAIFCHTLAPTAPQRVPFFSSIYCLVFHPYSCSPARLSYQNGFNRIELNESYFAHTKLTPILSYNDNLLRLIVVDVFIVEPHAGAQAPRASADEQPPNLSIVRAHPTAQLPSSTLDAPLSLSRSKSKRARAPVFNYCTSRPTR